MTDNVEIEEQIPAITYEKAAQYVEFLESLKEVFTVFF